jgi:hypothetical protein
MLWYTCLIKHAETLLLTKDCCTHLLLHAQQDALTQYKESICFKSFKRFIKSPGIVCSAACLLVTLIFSRSVYSMPGMSFPWADLSSECDETCWWLSSRPTIDRYCSQDPFNLCKETSDFVMLREEDLLASAWSLILLTGLVSLNAAVGPSQWADLRLSRQAAVVRSV